MDQASPGAVFLPNGHCPQRNTTTIGTSRLDVK